MDLVFLKTMVSQLASIWKNIKIYQKFTVVLVVLSLVTLLTVLTVKAASTRYTPLFSPQRLMITDAAEVKAFLESENIAYKLSGDTVILVPSDKIHRIRMELAALGLPKLNTGKGFELFDSNTWIKGEKELQILEMRALKGELEKDITEYDNIKTASVIIDVPPPRPFGGSLYKTKASAILGLMPGARLNASQLRAITYHISGAIRGLTPNMVAISDTTGKLYQSFDPNGDFDTLKSSEIALEERLKSKIDGMLSMVVGHDNFYSTVQVTMNRKKMSRERKIFSGDIDGIKLGDPVLISVTESGMNMKEVEKAEIGTPGTNIEAVAGAVVASSEDVMNRSENRTQEYKEMAVPVDHVKILSKPGKVNYISIGVLIDKTITIDSDSDLPQSIVAGGKRNTELLKKEVVSQLEKILEGYGLKATPAVDFVEFDKTYTNAIQEEEEMDSLKEIALQVATVLFVLLIALGMLWTFNKFWKKQMTQSSIDESEEDQSTIDASDEPSILELEAMVEVIKAKLNEDPQIIVDTLQDWIEEENPLSFIE